MPLISGDLFGEHPQRVGLAASAGDGRQQCQQQRDADPVVKAALDVQRLPHNLRKSGVRDDRATKPGIGRSEDHAQDKRLAERERAEQGHRDQPSQHDRQRQAGAKQGTGIEAPRRSARRFTREESENSTTASVASASVRTVEFVGRTVRSSSTSGPARTPTATTTIAGVKGVLDKGRDTAATSSSVRPTITRPASTASPLC